MCSSDELKSIVEITAGAEAIAYYTESEKIVEDPEKDSEEEEGTWEVSF